VPLVAFVHRGDIWTVRTDGSGLRNLTRTAHAAEAAPAWSPDGQSLAYMRGTAVWEMNANGANQRQIVPPVSAGFQTAAAAGVAWSSKGQIAYATYDDTRSMADIAVANADGSGAHALGLDPNLPGESRSPRFVTLTWTPDGSGLVFDLDNIDNRFGIWRVNADGSGLRHVVGTLEADFAPAFSPDGTRLVYTRPRTLPNSDYDYDLRLATASGARAGWLTRLGGADIGGSWSRTGRQIVFASQRGSEKPRVGSPYDLYVIAVGSRHVHRLLHLPGSETDPQWQPG
jgi:Tol biopolymer transport system component